MKAADPAAYGTLKQIDIATPTALGSAFRGLMLTTTTAGTIGFTITTIAGQTVTGVIFACPANTTIIVPIAGNNIIKTSGGTGFTAFALV